MRPAPGHNLGWLSARGRIHPESPPLSRPHKVGAQIGDSPTPRGTGKGRRNFDAGIYALEGKVYTEDLRKRSPDLYRQRWRPVRKAPRSKRKEGGANPPKRAVLQEEQMLQVPKMPEKEGQERGANSPKMLGGPGLTKRLFGKPYLPPRGGEDW